MRSLYLKIFLWFWIAVVALITASAVVTYTMRRDSLIEPFRISNGQLSADAQTAAFTYEKQGREALRSYVYELSKSGDMRAYFFSSHGILLAGPHPSIVVWKLEGNARHRIYDPGLLLIRIFRVQPAEGPSGRWYTFISEANPTGDEHAALIIRFSVVALTATLVCLALTRHLTAPIGTMRAATRQIARGKFSTRVGKKVGRRGDELGWLAQDFDKMAEQLEVLRNSQQRLLADISHELRSPLARLNVALEIARRDGPEGAPTAFERIERESQRLNELIGELMTITRLESSAEITNPRDVDMNILVREIATDADYEARGKGDRRVDLTDQTEGQEHAIVSGDPELLRRAVENIVRNAVKYTKEGTAVEVTFSRLKVKGTPSCRITVRDHGPGVPESALGDIFKPFYRLEAARDRQSGGVGLGLAIVERAVTLHGGDVKAENADGGGLQVTITLPCPP